MQNSAADGAVNRNSDPHHDHWSWVRISPALRGLVARKTRSD